jgi:hypothetical protein
MASTYPSFSLDEGLISNKRLHGAVSLRRVPMRNLSWTFSAALVGLLPLAAVPAKADYQYTFDSSYGAIRFTTPSIIPADSNGPFDLTFTEGSAGGLDTQRDEFNFGSGTTNC